MAVEVLDYQGFSKLQREGDVDEAMLLHLQSMQNLVTLLAKQQDCTPKAESDATISDFKKLIPLLGGSGHARFRRAPAIQLSQIPSQQHVSNKVRSSSAPSRDAVESKQVSDIDVQPNSACNPLKSCMRSTSVHDASPIAIDTQKGRVFQPFTSCSRSENEDKVHAHACSVSTNDALQMLCIARLDKLNSYIHPLNQSCSPCKEGNRDKNHSSLQVSGHARCRDSTAQKFCHPDSAVSSLACSQVHNEMPYQFQHPFQSCAEMDQAAFVPKANSSFLSSLSTDGGAGTVSNGKPVISSGRPPLPPKKRKSPEKIEDRTIKCHNSGNCHCAKRRKLKTRRIVRVSTMGLTNGDIPGDGYSWCIYGERLSKDSSQPRVYYKCSNVRGCPARKHVERASDDPNTLIVTYGREHLHPQIHKVLMTSE